MSELGKAELKKWTDELSRMYFDKPFLDEVIFNFRLRTTGGRYIPSKRLIELNPRYLHELGKDEFEGIIKHELCHYHLHIEGKGYNHRDREFRQLLKETNSPRFCKPLPSQKASSLHTYRCTDCSQEYRRKRRVNTKRYRCGKCKGILKKI